MKFVRQRSGEQLPGTEISPGDLVMVSKRDPTGTVTQVTNHSVTVALDGEPPGFVFGEGLGLDHYKHVTFQRMLDALSALPDAEGSLARHRGALVGSHPPAPPEPDRPTEWFDDLDAGRVGHPARVTPEVREHTLDALLADNETHRESERVRGEALNSLSRRVEFPTLSPARPATDEPAASPRGADRVDSAPG